LPCFHIIKLLFFSECLFRKYMPRLHLGFSRPFPWGEEQGMCKKVFFFSGGLDSGRGYALPAVASVKLLKNYGEK
jgi:hypothetical protein